MRAHGRTIEVTQRIGAPAGRIFALLATPSSHEAFDGSNMLRGSSTTDQVREVGDTFVMSMHRLGRDYSMINHIVEFEPDRRIFWQPAPNDLDTAGGDQARLGVPSGYTWGFVLAPDGEGGTLVTEIFDCGVAGDWILEKQDGSWINGANSVEVSMGATLDRLAALATTPPASS